MSRLVTICVALVLSAIFVEAFALARHNALQSGTWRSRNYQVQTDLPPEESRPIAAHMDAVFDEFERRFSSFPAKNSTAVRLYLFGTNIAYQTTLTHKGLNAANTGGVFFWNEQEAGLATFLEGQTGLRMYHVLQHEGFHQFAYIRIGDKLPIWANEGVAEYFGQSILVKGRLRTGVAPASRIGLLQEEIKRELAFPLDELLTISHQRWNMAVSGGDERAGVLYDQSWSVVHFLIHAEKGRYADALETYIRIASTGAAPEQAMIKAFGSLDAARAMDKKWRSWVLDEWKADPISTAAERLEFLGEGVRMLAAKDIRFATMDELQAQLRAANFKSTRIEHGIKRTLAATDDTLFQPPELDKPGRVAPAFELRPPSDSRNTARLPEIHATGLPVFVRLKWKGDASEPVPEIIFE